MSVLARPRGRGRAQNGQHTRGNSSTDLGQGDAPRSRVNAQKNSSTRLLPQSTGAGSLPNQNRNRNRQRGTDSGRGVRRSAVKTSSPLSQEISDSSGIQRWRDPTVEGNSEYKDRMHELWLSVRIYTSHLLTGEYQ